MNNLEMAKDCGAECYGEVGRRVTVSVEGHIIFTPDELDQFAARVRHETLLNAANAMIDTSDSAVYFRRWLRKRAERDRIVNKTECATCTKKGNGGVCGQCM